MQDQRRIVVAALCAAAFLAVACDDREETDETNRPPATTPGSVDRQTPPQRTPLDPDARPGPGAREPREPREPSDASAARQQPGATGATGATARDANEFVRQAASSGMYEVQSSQLAVDKEIDAGTKEFARKMIEDHTAANAKLKSVAAEQRLEVPEAMLPPQQKMLEALQAADGEQFARIYRQQQLQAHQQAVQLFENATRQLGAGPLGKFASETLPVLRRHLEHVKTLAGTAPGAGQKDAAGTGATGTGGDKR